MVVHGWNSSMMMLPMMLLMMLGDVMHDNNKIVKI
jgi:hypothetical protein